ncbi:hypothetical protein Ahy_A07g035426 isoform B [Arachis hypogaea]|uniref:DNA/RNA-binding domain-containing protein n=1 Tax=Arachis hypogaea TaxID=3818 RepID=A0A445CDU0_ARAHY|nr:hypothetical protein Ahy_A07g035426 isoform A [Arachis hypogaea]RYR49122.1 hypothetical protein Ahy_A07g035426 isoform B [Arachis hypogaea]
MRSAISSTRLSSGSKLLHQHFSSSCDLLHQPSWLVVASVAAFQMHWEIFHSYPSCLFTRIDDPYEPPRLYGEVDSVKREFAAASSYYLQANSLWPSSGNPHHQLALLASYSEDELAATYHYFRSLVVESRFSTAKDNLIAAFEKVG